MASIFSFPPAADSDLPFARRALARNAAEIAGLEREVIKLNGMRQRLEADLGVVDVAKREIDDILNKDAQGLIDRLRSGVEATLSAFGSRARSLDERLAASKHQAAIAERAIAAIDVELERLAAVLDELRGREQFLIADVIREATAPVLEDYATCLANMRDCLVYLSAIDRILGPPRHEFTTKLPGCRDRA